MRFFKIYGRVLGALGSDTRLAWLLGGASLLVAALQFLDPVLFGRVIGLLTYADQLPRNRLWAEAAQLLGIWFVVGGVGILASMATALHAERMAHRQRLQIMNRYFGHVLSLPLSFHGDVHSGRLMKVMLSGSDSLFQLWVSFFREQLSAYVATLGPGPAIPTEDKYDPEAIPEDEREEAVVRGGEFFRTNCTACHNFAGTGGALPGGKYAPS